MSDSQKRASGDAGATAEHEYERRSLARRRRVRERYGPVGSILTALAGEPHNVHAWKQGAEGEAATARALERHLRRTDVVVLHDRRIPGRGRANIDHIAIGPGGITVIDTKSSRGQVELRTVGVISRRELLLVNGRDRTSQLDALEHQVERVAAVLDRHGADYFGAVGALCFPFMRRGFLHYSHARDGLTAVDDPRHVAKVANRSGPLTPDDIQDLAARIAAAFPPAV
jgi:hypothetical protein